MREVLSGCGGDCARVLDSDLIIRLANRTSWTTCRGAILDAWFWGSASDWLKTFSPSGTRSLAIRRRR